MRLLIDVDGVLADQVPPALARLNHKYGLAIAKRQIRTWDEPIADTNIKVAIETFLTEREFILRMPLVPGARSALRRLAETHHITIATSRAEVADQPTREWLALKGIPYDDYVNTSIVGKDKLQGDLLVDDYPGNAVRFQGDGRHAILFDQPWNRADPGALSAIASGLVLRATAWPEVLTIIESISKRTSPKASA